MSVVKALREEVPGVSDARWVMPQRCIPETGNGIEHQSMY